MTLTSIYFTYRSMDNGAYLGGACSQGADDDDCEAKFWEFIDYKYGLSPVDIYIASRNDISDILDKVEASL